MFTFTNDLLTGVYTIDSAHQQIIDQAEKITQLALEEKIQPKINEALYFLEEYVIVHFDQEETIQRDSDYPGYISHKNFHDLFRDRLEAIIEQHDANPTSPAIKENIVKLFGEIFYTHILTMDQELAAYLREVGFEQ